MVVTTTDLLTTSQKSLKLKNAEAEGLSPKVAAADKELARLRKKLEEAEKAKVSSVAPAREAEEREKKSFAAAKEKERKYKEEISSLQSSIEDAKKEAVAEYLKSDEFVAHCANGLVPYYEKGKNHILRMVSSEGIATNQLLSWALATHYYAQARGQHGVVEFTEDELLTVQEEDAENKLEPWTPPPVKAFNVTKLIGHVRGGGDAKCDHGH